jgi:hypothetical protein
MNAGNRQWDRYGLTALVGAQLPDALIDVGANIGEVSYYAKRLGIDRVIAIDPDPIAAECLEFNLEDTQKNRNIFTALEARTADGTAYNSKLLTRTSCAKVGAPGCDFEKYFQYTTALSFCSSSLKSDCVSSVFAKDQNGSVVEGKFIEYFPGAYWLKLYLLMEYVRKNNLLDNKIFDFYFVTLLLFRGSKDKFCEITAENN